MGINQSTMLVKHLQALILSIIIPLAALSQTTREEVYADLNKAGGVYFAYPVTEASVTPPPSGYEPFYVSHYGRHGSRYLVGDNDYEWVLKLMRRADEAGALTALGKDVLQRLESVWDEAEGRGGDLSPIGVRQQRGICERMYGSYTKAFEGEKIVSAYSTTVMRCAMSMTAFCDRLKELNPKLGVTFEASNRNMCFMNYHSPESNEFTAPDGEWQEEYRKFEESLTHGGRLTESLFRDSLFVVRNVNPYKLIWGFYWIAVDMQDMETNVSFFDIFEPEELFNLWQAFNARFYACDGNYAGNGGLMLGNAKNLLRNILDCADEAIADSGVAATLRFGHDGNLIPLAGLLRLGGCYDSVSNPHEFYKHFADFKIAPMAGNVQIVFFRNKKDAEDVIVKFMLNERETSIPIDSGIFPFYKWDDVKAFYEGILSE